MSNASQTFDQGTAEQYLTFSLGQETFAVSTRNVREIIEFGRLTPVPMMPASVLGVINLRGGVVPIMDLCQRFGEGETRIGRRSCIVILDVSRDEVQQTIGIVVEAVSAVLEIPPQDIEPAPTFGSHIRTDFIRGMGKIDGNIVVLLDIGRVLSLEDMQQLASTAASASKQSA